MESGLRGKPKQCIEIEPAEPAALDLGDPGRACSQSLGRLDWRHPGVCEPLCKAAEQCCSTLKLDFLLGTEQVEEHTAF
jgi:hypothetical protein